MADDTRSKLDSGRRDSSLDGSVGSGMTRRAWLQVVGTSGAAVAVGCGTLPGEPSDSVLEGGSAQAAPVSPEEATRLRHLRHRRQAHGGDVQASYDPFTSCDQRCTAAMFAHEFNPLV